MSEPLKFSELANFTPKQWEAVDASNTCKFLFYGGAKGGGKSYFLRWMAIYLALHYFTKYGLRNVRIMIACENYPALHDRHLTRIKFEYPAWLGKYRSTEKEFHLDEAYGGAQICFRNLDDPEKYHSAEYAAVLVDELPLNPNDIFRTLRSILRWKGLPDQECRFIGTGNPSGVGLGWVKRLWIDRVYDEGDNPAQFAFVQAFSWDNPHIDKGYIESLRNLPEAERKAYLEGSWDVFKGQFFYEWRKDVHTCLPFDIPRGQGKWFRSLDWGERISSVGWWWLSPEGRLYRVRELYRGGLKPSQLAETIKSMTREEENILCTVADPSIFGRKDLETGRSIADILHQRGVPCIPGNNNRKAGWALAREWLAVYDEEVLDPATGLRALRPTAKMQVFASCRDFIRTIPNLVYDENDPDDLDTKGEDHAGDEWRYLIMQLPISAIVQREHRPMARNAEEAWRQMEGLTIQVGLEEDFNERSLGW